METGKSIQVTANFAGNVIPVGMYDKSKPSDLLKTIMMAEKECGSLDFSKEMTERIMNFLSAWSV